jgi:hypothetical protein
VDANRNVRINLYLFWSTTCPHCAQALEFTRDLQERRPWVNVYACEITGNPANRVLYSWMAAGFKGVAGPPPAESMAREPEVPLAPAEVTAFADGETRVRPGADVRGAAVAIVQPTSPPVNDHLMVLALMIARARAAGAAWVGAVVPYPGYARQEQRGLSYRPGFRRCTSLGPTLSQ